ncbi:pyocin knob domain-containing S74 family peptidase [Chromobacterium violaceum]|uniref:pyocin knob domain-containing S74 family peptidase n=1 Tax=Chromobacterium violaceum TaxID=536 RepID=UPI001E2887FC|nr:pyocin knob domain-containing S74 family peptidase [Chromobacterium violaceum]MCD0494811.1 pyocin knob domain-containing S74 family peptidase [Chromobacterium violaceum]
MSVDTNWYRVGRISVAQGSVEVRGEGASWEGQTSEGDILIGPDGRWYEVATVAAEVLQLRTPYLGATVKAQPYAVVRNFTGSQLGRVAADLAKMQRRWLTTLGGFRDVLFSDQPQATLYDELGDAHVVMPWPAIQSAVKDALTKVEAARVVVVDNAADLIAARNSAQDSAKAAKASQDAAAANATATKLNRDAVEKSQAAVTAAEKRVAASATAADASAKAAKLSQDAAAASADSVAGAALAVEEARKVASWAARKGDPVRVNAANGYGVGLDVFSTGSGKLTAYGPKGDGALLDLDAIPADADQGSTIRMFRAVKTSGPAMVDMYAADGTNTLVHRMGVRGSDTYLHQEGGRVQIGRSGMPSRLDVVGQSRADTVRAGKGYPNKGDSSAVGYGFDDDADTGLFADYEGDKPVTGTKNLALFINSKNILEVDLQGRIKTPAYGVLENKFADRPYVDAAVAKIVDSAPDALNTLKELSAALNNDAKFSDTVASQLAKKLEPEDLAGYGLGGNARNIRDGALFDKRANGFYHGQTSDGKGLKGTPSDRNGMFTVNYLNDQWGTLTYRAWGGEVYEARLENGVWSGWNRHWHTGNDGALLMFRDALGAAVDLNTCRKNGWFYQPANANASTGSNYPWAVAGALSVLEQGGMTFQQYQTYHPDNTQLYFRSRYNERWGEWVKVWHNRNHGAGSGLDADTVDGVHAADLLSVAGNQIVTGEKTFNTQIITNPPKGAWDTWRDWRVPALQVNCPDNSSAYMVWRATKWGERHLAAMDVHAGGSANSPVHVSLSIGGDSCNHIWRNNDYMAKGNIDAQGSISAANGTITGGAINADMSGSSQASLQARNVPNAEGDAGMASVAFHCQGKFAVKLGLRADGYFGVGGWSALAWRWFVDTKTGDMTAAGNVTWFSDKRLKTDIEPIADALDKVRRLNGYTFTRKDTGARQVGLIAQEVQAVQPEAVIEAADEAKTLTVAYGNLVGLLVEALKEQQRNFEQLEARIAQLEAV